MKRKLKNSKLFKLRYFIVFIISISFGFYLYKIPYINYKFLSLINNVDSKKLTNKSSSKSNNTEILFSPYIMDNSTCDLNFSHFDLTLGFALEKKEIDLSKLNFLPTVIVKGNSKIINNDKKITYIDSENFSKIDILNNSIVFMYLNNDLSDISTIYSYSKMIKDYIDKNYFIVLYIDPNIQINYKAINFLCNQGVNLIFSPSINSTYIEKCNNSIIIYGVENNSYIPQFDIIFNDKKPIALGIKFFSHTILPDSTIKEIENRSKNISFKISNIFSFFDY